MNFTVKPLKIFRTLQEIIQLDLIPSNFNPLILIKCSISESIKNRTNKKNNEKKQQKTNLSDSHFYQQKPKQREAQILTKSKLAQIKKPT